MPALPIRPEHARAALYSQDACNVSGLVHSLNKIMPGIWEDAHAAGLGTAAVNTHPVVRLFAEQIMHLSRSGADDTESYTRASAACHAACHAAAEPRT